jgi:hypothetical protein
MNKWLALILVVIIFLFLKAVFVGPEKPENVEEKYEAEWRSPGTELIEISSVLVKNKVTGCGEYYIKENKMSDGEYILACTSDRIHWNYYAVWIPSGDFMGPLTDNFSKPK